MKNKSGRECSGYRRGYEGTIQTNNNNGNKINSHQDDWQDQCSRFYPMGICETRNHKDWRKLVSSIDDGSCIKTKGGKSLSSTSLLSFATSTGASCSILFYFFYDKNSSHVHALSGQIPKILDNSILHFLKTLLFRKPRVQNIAYMSHWSPRSCFIDSER